ncbi:MAG TPA: class I SAM-dependent methyltransferase [Symbiobacteriaceae bacterium]|nr:class I SAM-dependent methyltransferase [Symbiobacteriaceae bacterium]
MGQDWYEAYARRFGGYRKLWDSRMEGEDGEAAFTAFLRQTVRPHHRVLDVGCGDGLYTLHLSALAEHVTGLDYSPEMIALARRNQQSAAIPNASFVCGSTSGGAALPFPEQSFDLIYSRRGPTSHLADARRLLRPGGLVAGIHTGARDEILHRLTAAGFRILRNDEYRGTEVIPTREDYALYLSRVPGNPDYSVPAGLADLPDGCSVPRWWFIWVGENKHGY